MSTYFWAGLLLFAGRRVFVRNGAPCFIRAGSCLESPGRRQQHPLPGLLFHELVVCLNLNLNTFKAKAALDSFL